jgi:EcoRII C terminal
MKKGYLSQYFEGVAAKRLSAVEVDRKISHQHEFNGSKALKLVLGTDDSGVTLWFPTSFIWMGEENETITASGQLSWYNSRVSKPRAPEWRLFYPTNDVMSLAKEGDLLFIAKRTDGSVLSIIVTSGSTVENQLLWLFAVPVQTGKSFVYQDIQNKDDKEVDFAVRFILEELGIDIEEPEADYLDNLLVPFNRTFPTTKIFSTFARNLVKDCSPQEEPDKTLMAWMEQEEKLFRRLERQIVEQRLQNGFAEKDGMDVDGFISFSLSVQNRRKSRAGLALENHLEEIFNKQAVRYSRVGITENKAKPDFLFPDINSYHSSDYPAEMLTMLGVKTTCKDRWRQVLSEAHKIPKKHLLTLEPGISESQTDEMKSHNLQLVLPASLHSTYKNDQRSWLIDVNSFIKIVKNNQNR